MGYEIIGTALRLAGLLINLRPPPKPYKPDFSGYEELMKRQYEKLGTIPAFSGAIALPPANEQNIPVIEESVESEESHEPDYGPGGKAISTSCINCSRSHLVTISGALDEGLRFAREGGITHPEAIRRIALADKEINIMERIDLSPDAIQKSPVKDQEMARYFLPKIRKLRQDIGNIKSAEDMERTAAESDVLTQEFRLKQMASSGVNLNPIMELAKRVQAGELTMEEARLQVKQYLPHGG